MNRNMFSIAVCGYGTTLIGGMLSAAAWPDPQSYIMMIGAVTALAIAISATIETYRQP